MSKSGTLFAVLAGIAGLVILVYFVIFKRNNNVAIAPAIVSGVETPPEYLETIPTDTQISPELLNATKEEQKEAGYTPAPIAQPIALSIAVPLAAQQALVTDDPNSTLVNPIPGVLQWTCPGSKSDIFAREGYTEVARSSYNPGHPEQGELCTYVKSPLASKTEFERWAAECRSIQGGEVAYPVAGYDPKNMPGYTWLSEIFRNYSTGEFPGRTHLYCRRKT